MTDVENKLVITCGESGGGGRNWETEIDIYTHTIMYKRDN